MKIDAYLNGVLEKYIKQSKTQKAEKINITDNTDTKTQAPQKGELDKVEISPEAKLLSELSADEYNKTQRIKQVKAQLENGTYKPPIDKIAESILKEWKGE